FAIFTLASVALSLTPSSGPAGSMELIVFRVVQGIGGALLMANSTAILTDAFPVAQRGMAMGINMIAAVAGSFLGLIRGRLAVAAALTSAGLSGLTFTLIIWLPGICLRLHRSSFESPPL